VEVVEGSSVVVVGARVVAGLSFVDVELLGEVAVVDGSASSPEQAPAMSVTATRAEMIMRPPDMWLETTPPAQG
jgi:hypothetical protein